MARIPGFHPGYPGSIPGQGIKILLHATTHCCLSEISLGSYTSALSRSESVQSLLRYKGKDWTLPLEGRLAQSHCGRAKGMRDIAAAFFGNTIYNQDPTLTLPGDGL